MIQADNGELYRVSKDDKYAEENSKKYGGEYYSKVCHYCWKVVAMF